MVLKGDFVRSGSVGCVNEATPCRFTMFNGCSFGLIEDQVKMDDDECGESKQDKEQVVVLKHTERGTSVGCVNEAEKPWDDGNFSAIGNRPQDKIFCDLVKDRHGKP